jgi:hypothetical protein
MKNFFVKVLALVSFAGFVACNDDDPVPQGVGDAYIISRIAVVDEEEVVVYGLHMEAGAVYGTLSSVKATVGTTNYTLEKYTGAASNSFFYEQDTYGLILPAEGNYTFSYTFTTGETNATTDALTDDVLAPADITKADYSSEKIEVKWDEVDEADAILVRLKDSDGDIVFSPGGYLAGDKTEFTISTSTGTWDSGHNMTNGATYTVEVLGVLADSQNYYQALSIGTATVVWGVE